MPRGADICEVAPVGVAPPPLAGADLLVVEHLLAKHRLESLGRHLAGRVVQRDRQGQSAVHRLHLLRSALFGRVAARVTREALGA